MAEKHWMQGAVTHPGAFTAWAKAHNMSVHQAAETVMAHKNKYSGKLRKRASLALTFERTAKG